MADIPVFGTIESIWSYSLDTGAVIYWLQQRSGTAVPTLIEARKADTILCYYVVLYPSNISDHVNKGTSLW